MASTSHGHDLPPVDEMLPRPGERYEIIDGKPVFVPPALEPHGYRHMALGALLKAHVAPGFEVALDMLTRTSKDTMIAPDAAVYPKARTPVGGRQLEHVAFEIATTQRLADVSSRARRLCGRGVRRVFAITARGTEDHDPDDEVARVFEWSSTLDTWQILDASAVIDDAVFAVPVPISAIAYVAKTDDAIASALRAKGHAEFSAAREQGRLEALIAVLTARGMIPTESERAAILAERDPARVARWLAVVATCATVTELLDA